MHLSALPEDLCHYWPSLLPPSDTSISAWRDTPIVLESLRLRQWPARLAHPLMQNPNILDLSHLKFAPLVRSIEFLHLSPNEEQIPLHLPIFPNLTHLRILMLGFMSAPFVLCLVLDTMSGIDPSNVIRQITIAPSPPVLGQNPECCGQLDPTLSTLSTLHHLCLVELEMDPTEYNRVIPHFPRMTAKNLICRVDYAVE
ncbi:hypothetical protein B0H19DRAFT_1271266 [Mycena capillaripes]|nr:hypothetical protein B0H19DRAFT_1271266 [Mycena capillaripes]